MKPNPLVTAILCLLLIVPPPAQAAGSRDFLSILGGLFAPVTQEQEIQAGAQLDRSVRQKYTVSSNLALQHYVGEVGAKIARQTGKTYPFQYTVLEDPKTVNAFAGPGGYIYITTGLLSLLDNEAQLAAVLAHETAHVTERHVVKQMQEQYGTSLSLLLLGRLTDINLNNRLTQLGQFLLQQKFSRGDEVDADLHGVDLMVKAGYSPKGMTQLLNKLSALDARGASIPFLQNHPPSRERSATVQEYISHNQLVRPNQIMNTPNFQRMHAQMVSARL